MALNDRPIPHRIKGVLAEQRRTNKWLADALGKDYTTASKGCTCQPTLEMLFKVAERLDVEAGERIVKSMKSRKE